jgi:hypothetical protein
MSLSDRFELFGLKRDDGVRTFEAKEIATGRPVLVHFLPANNPLLRRLDGLPETERSRVVDRGDAADGLYLVTDRLMDFAGFREWVSQDGPKPLSAGGAWQMSAPSAPKPLNVDSNVDSQFEDLFGKAPPIPAPTLGPTPVLSNTAEITLQMPAIQEAPHPLTPAPPPPPVVIKEPPKENEPGEFTRQFAPVLRPISAPKPELVPKPSPSPSNEPGEFTRQFAPPVLRPTPTPTPPTFAPPTANEPGEFTQMLQAQRPASPTQAAPAPSMSSSQETEFAKYFQSPMTPAPSATPITPPPPPKRAFQAGNAGEFTQVFGRADIPVPPPVLRPSPPPIQQSVPETTQAFEKPRTPPPMYTPPLPPVSKGPGEYTRQFSAPAPLTFGQAPATPPAPRMQLNIPTVKRKSLLPLFLMLGGGCLLLLAVIVYLVMRSRA